MLEVIVGCEGVCSAALQTVELSVCTRMHTDRHLHLFKVWKNGRIKKGRMHVNWIVGDLSLLQQRPLNSRAGSKVCGCFHSTMNYTTSVKMAIGQWSIS